MGYEFHSDINIEYPFFVRMAQQLGGKRKEGGFNGKESYRYCQCPSCGKYKAVMGYAKTGNTFILACPVDTCSLQALTLHQLIKRCGGEEMFDEWRKARWKTTYTEDWFPRKNY